MKFQTLALLGLFALTTTVTAQSASAQVPNQTHLTAGDVATIATDKPSVRPSAKSATQTLNLTHLTSDKVSVLQVNRVTQTVQPLATSLTLTQMSSDDTASIGINPSNPQDSIEHGSQTVQPAVSSTPIPAQMSSDDTASVGIISRSSQGSTDNLIAAQPEYSPSPIVDVVVHRQVNRTSHTNQNRTALRPVSNPTHLTISAIE